MEKNLKKYTSICIYICVYVYVYMHTYYKSIYAECLYTESHCHIPETNTILEISYTLAGLPNWPKCTGNLSGLGGTRGKEPTCQCRRHKRSGFDPSVGKIPWRRAWQPTPMFLPRESHGQRSLAGCWPWDLKESARLRWRSTAYLNYISDFLNQE